MFFFSVANQTAAICLHIRNSLRKVPSLPDIIDLRSDTVTKPSAQMRAAMAAAEVGDDVYGEDPTVNKLERRAAEIFGREAALFVPTGTMGNQIGIRLHTQPGQEVIAESRSHILDWEMATTAVFSGCLVRAVEAPRGILTWQHIEPVIYKRGPFRAATGLIEIENTANLAGGSVTPLPVLEEIWAGAAARNLPVHLDGARIFNAATGRASLICFARFECDSQPLDAGRRHTVKQNAGMADARVVAFSDESRKQMHRSVGRADARGIQNTPGFVRLAIFGSHDDTQPRRGKVRGSLGGQHDVLQSSHRNE